MEDFAQVLVERGWGVDVDHGCALGSWKFKNKYITCLASEAIDEAGDEVVTFEYAYISRYAQTSRSKLLLKAYFQKLGKAIIYSEPNRLKLDFCISTIDDEGEVIDPAMFDNFAVEKVLHFLEVVTAYEVCARLTDPDTRILERYRKVLPSQQIEMIVNNHLVS